MSDWALFLTTLILWPIAAFTWFLEVVFIVSPQVNPLF
jgi:hypothetical protein